MNRSILSQILVPVLILILFVVGIYGVVRLRNNIDKEPTLDVSVEDNSATTNDTLDLAGTTSARDLTINNNKVNVANDGSFSYQVILNKGANKLTFVATTNGKSTTIERTITREVVSVPSSDNLTDSGPAENIGIVGLTGLIFAGYYYLASKRRNTKTSYKLFTRS